MRKDLPPPSLSVMADAQWICINIFHYLPGINQPRQRSCTGGPLPSPRTISNVLHKSGHCSVPSRRFTVLAMQFGQFIEHDVISTPLQRGSVSVINFLNPKLKIMRLKIGAYVIKLNKFILEKKNMIAS